MVAGQRLLDRLLKEKRISRSHHERALQAAARSKEHAEEALLKTGAIDEAELLKYKAGLYQTQFILAQKLATAAVDRGALTLVPRKTAAKLGVFPILYDRKAHRLSIVAADFEAHDVVKQVQLVTGLQRVVAYVCRPAAVWALQRKHYRGDATAFVQIGVGEARRPAPVARAATTRQAAPIAVSFPPPSVGAPRTVPLPDFQPPVLADTPSAKLPAQEGPASPRKVPMPPAIGPAQPLPFAPGIGDSLAQQAPLVRPELPQGGVPEASFEELFRVLVTLLEQSRGALRGHSAAVARLADEVAGRIGLDDAASFAIRLACYAHDLGKGQQYHLTALNVAEFDGHRTQATKAHMTALRLLDGVSLPKDSVGCLTHLYERFDGKGFPDRLQGKDIPVGARLLALVETYCDLISHDKTPFRKKLTPPDAWEAMRPFRGSVFDPDLFDVAASVVLGREGDTAGGQAGTVVVVDPDAEGTMVLELRLLEGGYNVLLARSAKEALECLDADVTALITEVDLSPFDGFELVERARKSLPELTVVFLTERGDAASVKRGYDLAAVDYLVKPVPAELIAAKLEQVLVRREEKGAGGGVSGALSEMSLPDVIQILCNGRRSGSLTLKAAGVDGLICFHDGAVWDAAFGAHKGAEAVYQMLTLQEGDFSFNRGAAPAERTIQDSTEALLLEGMRRFDEGG